MRAQIRDGVLPPGARVPSRNAIIARYGVGETAAKHALAVLAAEGLIEARAGSGSYVRRIPAERLLEHDRLHFPGSPFGLGGRPVRTTPMTRTAVAAKRCGWPGNITPSGSRRSRPVARRLRLDPGDEQVVRTRYLLTADSLPVQLVTSFEPMAITAGTPVLLPEQGQFAGRGVIARMGMIGIVVDQVTEEIAVGQPRRRLAPWISRWGRWLCPSSGRTWPASGSSRYATSSSPPTSTGCGTGFLCPAWISPPGLAQPGLAQPGLARAGPVERVKQVRQHGGLLWPPGWPGCAAVELALHRPEGEHHRIQQERPGEVRREPTARPRSCSALGPRSRSHAAGPASRPPSAASNT